MAGVTREPDDPVNDERSEAERLRETVRTFLDDVDRTYGEYDRGYADADATLRVLRGHVEELREEVEE